MFGLSGQELSAYHRLRIAAQLDDEDTAMFSAVFGVAMEEMIFPAAPMPVQAGNGVDDIEVSGQDETEVGSVANDGEVPEVPAPADAAVADEDDVALAVGSGDGTNA